jgi:hypothetical protein
MVPELAEGKRVWYWVIQSRRELEKTIQSLHALVDRLFAVAGGCDIVSAGRKLCREDIRRMLLGAAPEVIAVLREAIEDGDEVFRDALAEFDSAEAKTKK